MFMLSDMLQACTEVLKGIHSTVLAPMVRFGVCAEVRGENSSSTQWLQGTKLSAFTMISDAKLQLFIVLCALLFMDYHHFRTRKLCTATTIQATTDRAILSGVRVRRMQANGQSMVATHVERSNIERS